MQSLTTSSPTQNLTEQRAVYAVCGLLAVLPLVFTLMFGLGKELPSDHATLRMQVMAVVELIFILYVGFCVLGFKAIGAAMPKRVWLCIALLVCIAFAHIFNGRGSEVLTTNRTFMWVFHLIFGLSLFAVMQRMPRADVLRTAGMAIVGGTFLYLLLFIVMVALYGPPAGDQCHVRTPAFGNVRYSGFFVGAALAMLVVGAARSDTTLSLRLLAGIGAVLCWVYIEYSGSRGAVFALIGGTMAICLFQSIAASGRLLVVMAVTCGLGVAFSFLIPPAECSSFGLMNRFVIKVEAGDITTGRTAVWLATWDVIKEYPFFGRGEVRLRRVSDTNMLHTHNLVLQSLMSWGFVGAAIFFGLIAELMLRLLLGARRLIGWHTWPLLFAALTFLAYAQVDGALYNSYSILLMTVILASAAAIVLRPQQSENS